MNFLYAQDAARRNTGHLIVLFIIVVTLITMIAVAPVFLTYQEGDVTQALTIAGVIWGIILLGVAYKAVVLSGGGYKVAEKIGGTLILRGSADAAEQQLLNIVEEIALAAGTPVPTVYRLDDDEINAFAAGTTPGNAVIGVTSGAMRQLSREQMQGVIAHEFSHIVNGDMRLNIRLTAVIFGMMVIGFIGYFIFMLGTWLGNNRHDPDDRSHILVYIAGIGVMLLGFIGTFFGSWIRAAVSRQREFLADAAAVQYTRNPQGLASALERIGQNAGVIKAPRAAAANITSGTSKAMQAKDKLRKVEYAHMFFSGNNIAGFLSSPFATHPPLKKRIKRILPQWNENTPLNATTLPRELD